MRRNSIRMVLYSYGETKKRKKKEVSDFLVIGYLYSENTCNFIYVTSFCLFSRLLVL